MCGIAGIFHPDRSFVIDVHLLQNMTRAISYRGPDDEGFYLDNGIGLGQRRLSIIDVCGGKQPMCNEDGSIWVIFNGEIFNYLELMDYLKSKGHHFCSRSDTEVLVHLYEEYGEKFATKLNGQFAIALWDNNKRTLLLVRDRVGIRPLFYTRCTDGVFLFASEIKSIFCHPAVHPELDFAGLEQVFTLWVPVPPRTVFRGITELKPGYFLKVTAEGISQNCYWKLNFPGKDQYDEKPLEYYRKRLEELLFDAVTLRLRSDVTVAAYLSGGLDSSIISALVKKYHNRDLITFSVSFKDKIFDERSYQNTMVQFLKTDHRNVEVNYHDIGKMFPEVVWHTETPMIRTASAPLFALSRLVRDNHIKVVLTGEGADELFGGYNIFKENRIRRFWAKYPNSNCRPSLLYRIYPYIGATKNNLFWQAFFKNQLSDTSNPFYSHLIRWSNTSRINKFFTEKYREMSNIQAIYEELYNFIDPELASWDPLCQAQYLEITLFMSGYLLSSQGDRMMMGNSVEGRFPFLDYRIIEFASSVPPSFKLNLLNEKYILKKTFTELIPAEIINRAKQPYRAPISPCFAQKTNNLSSLMLEDDALECSGIFDIKSVRMLKEKLNSGVQLSEVDEMAVAAIISTQLLYHHFITELVPWSGSDRIKLKNPQNSSIIITPINPDSSIDVKCSDQG
ncbi:MAG TPA: asparagine synthase (glutamine-hydrolyzing) [Chitinispirillaceae bacterium]|nr:asparagine synthase (glutamine-hydrolyzing) [Chitinispirillaceae bacterium]